MKIAIHRKFSQARYWLAFVILVLGGAHVYGKEPGALAILSAQGEPLQLSMVLTEPQQQSIESGCMKAKAVSGDGVLITTLKIEMASKAIHLSSSGPVLEPDVLVSLDIGCKPRVHQDYPIILNLPSQTIRLKSPASPVESSTAHEMSGVAP